MHQNPELDGAQDQAVDTLATAIMAFRDSAEQSNIVQAFVFLFDQMLLIAPSDAEMGSRSVNESEAQAVEKGFAGIQVKPIPWNGQQRLAFRKASRTVIRKAVQKARAQTSSQRIDSALLWTVKLFPILMKLNPAILEAERNELRRKAAEIETRYWELQNGTRISTSNSPGTTGGSKQQISIGTLWCTFFKRPGLTSRLRIRDLEDAYRPPGLFASEMVDGGHRVEFVTCDEEAHPSDFDGTHRTLQDTVHLLYVMTHGRYKATGYEVLLHTTDWAPGSTKAGLGQNKLVVAVFDTCELIDGNQNWRAGWSGANLGTSLRLLLGFDGPAAIDRPHAMRGKAFAENLIRGKTFAEAWIQAVHSTATAKKSTN